MVGLDFPRPSRALGASRWPSLVRSRVDEARVGLAIVLIAAAAMRLVFAMVDPGPGRFWDERYGFRNVGAVLLDGRSEPAHALYPSLSFLPQTAVLSASEALHRWTGREDLSIFASREGRMFSPHAYRLARLVSVFCGLLGVWLTYRLGRRLFGPAVGVVGALLLACFWRHVTASAEFKPDALAVALVLLAAGWSLDAVRRGTWSAFALAGAGVGLAAAAKYNAAAVALVLVAAVALSGREAARMLPKLAGAGVASLAVFTLLNPWPTRVLADFRWQLAYYDRTAAGLGSDRGRVLLDMGEFFVRHHGWAIALAAAAGAALWVWRAVRHRPRDRGVAALLAFALGYPLLYAASTRLFLSQNLLPVAPLSALFAAWTIVGIWRWAVARWRPLAAPTWRYAAFAGLLVASLWLPLAATYAVAVPSAERRAGGLLANRLGPVAVRTVWFERQGEPIRVQRDREHLPVAPVGDLAAVDAEDLDLADAEVFPAERLEGAAAQVYRRRLTRQGVEAVLIEPAPFRVRGSPLAVALHPWEPVGDAIELRPTRETDRRWRAALPAGFGAGDVVSAAVSLPRTYERRWELSSLWLSGEELRFDQTSAAVTPRARFLSQRVRLGAAGGWFELELHSTVPADFEPRVEIYRWKSSGELSAALR